MTTNTKTAPRVPQRIETAIGRLHDVRAQLAFLKRAEKELVETLKEYIPDDTSLVHKGRILAEHRTTHGHRFDTKTFKENEPSIYELYLVDTVSHSVVVK